MNKIISYYVIFEKDGKKYHHIYETHTITTKEELQVRLQQAKDHGYNPVKIAKK